MATKVERAVLLPESIYNRIVRIAREEDSNIPWVTRQLLAKALADLKGKPEWFYEIEEQIEGLRNETVVVERAKAKRVERTAMHLEGAEEQLLVEIKKQIEELRKEIGEVRAETKAKLKEQNPKGQVGNRFVTRQLLVNALAEERKEPDRPDSADRFDEIQRDLAWLRSEVQASQRQREKEEVTGEQLYLELKKQVAELKAAMAEALGKTKIEIGYETAYELMLWPEVEAEPKEDPEQEEARIKQRKEDEEAAYKLLQWQEKEEEPMAEGVEEVVEEPLPEVASIKPAAKGKVLRPFFGRLTSMFNSVLG